VLASLGDYVAIPSDSRNADRETMPRAADRIAGRLGHPASAGPDHPVVDYLDGLENPSEAFHNSAAWLVRDGLSDEEIAKVLGGNVLRALADIWPA
jgi:membrane dipeptidase